MRMICIIFASLIFVNDIRENNIGEQATRDEICKFRLKEILTKYECK